MAKSMAQSEGAQSEGAQTEGAQTEGAPAARTAKPKLFQAVALFVVVTYAVSGVLFALQKLTGLESYVFYLPTIGPLVGGLVLIALAPRLDLPVKWVPGLGFNIQVIRRGLLLAAVAVAVVMMCVQIYSFLRWNMKPIALDEIHYPGLTDEYVPPVFAMICLGILVGVAMEEFGWRTVLQPTLRQAMPVWKTALVTGLIWSGWQWSVFAPVLNRWTHGGSLVVIAAYLVFWLLAQVSISMILVLAHNKMRRGQWVCATLFRFIYAVGFFLILDEEVGRWQAMWAMSMACAIVAGVGYYYYWRTLRRKQGAKRAGAVAGPNKPKGPNNPKNTQSPEAAAVPSGATAASSGSTAYSPAQR